MAFIKRIAILKDIKRKQNISSEIMTGKGDNLPTFKFPDEGVRYNEESRDKQRTVGKEEKGKNKIKFKH